MTIASQKLALLQHRLHSPDDANLNDKKVIITILAEHTTSAIGVMFNTITIIVSEHLKTFLFSKFHF